MECEATIAPCIRPIKRDIVALQVNVTILSRFERLTFYVVWTPYCHCLLVHLLTILSVSSCKILLRYGHIGIVGNDTADLKARETTQMLFTGNVSVPKTITYSDACKISTDIAVKSWQRKWNELDTGRYTYELIPNVGAKILFPAKRDIGVSYLSLIHI